LEELLELIHVKYGYDFRDYSKASMHRRVSRFMDDAGFKTLYDLKLNIINSKDVFDFFLQRVTVNVTEMFRDPAFYKALKQDVIPVLATFPIIKIWACRLFIRRRSFFYSNIFT
jgi:chemotaxis protein methyltransferase CheR